jgi:hypothetical protein
MTSNLIETWGPTGILDEVPEEERGVLASHLHEAFTLDFGEGSGMFFAGEEISEENARIMLITITQKIYRTHRISFDIKHLYENMVTNFNNLSSSLLEIAMVVPDPEMEFISLFGEMYNPKEKEIKIDPKKFITKFKL